MVQRHREDKTKVQHKHFYEPKLGHGLKHDPMSSIVGPRVIGWIGTQSVEGVFNLAPYSFCTMFNYRPPIIGFASVGYKDSARNAIETGVFTWNLATRSLAEQVNLSSIEQPVDEFALTGLTPQLGERVAAPYVAESPVSLECKVSQHFELTGSDGVGAGSWMVLGEVVAVHIATEHIRDGVYHCASAHPVLRGGGPKDYYEITDDTLFGLYRPR